MYCIIAISIICLIIFLVWASANIGSNVYLKTLCRAETDRKVVAITFDDGPDAEMTPRILDILNRHAVKATFFLTGAKAEKNAATVRRIIAEGHAVGNHTYSHRATFPLSRSRKVAEELDATRTAIERAGGGKLVRLFRPPFGVTNPIIGREVKRRGLQTIGWSIRSLDTIKSRSREAVCKRITDNLHSGAILLLHDVCDDADRLLEMVINETKRRGYGIVPLDELLNIEIYED